MQGLKHSVMITCTGHYTSYGDFGQFSRSWLGVGEVAFFFFFLVYIDQLGSVLGKIKAKNVSSFPCVCSPGWCGGISGGRIPDSGQLRGWPVCLGEYDGNHSHTDLPGALNHSVHDWVKLTYQGRCLSVGVYTDRYSKPDFWCVHALLMSWVVEI